MTNKPWVSPHQPQQQQYGISSPYLFQAPSVASSDFYTNKTLAHALLEQSPHKDPWSTPALVESAPEQPAQPTSLMCFKELTVPGLGDAGQLRLLEPPRPLEIAQRIPGVLNASDTKKLYEMLLGFDARYASEVAESRARIGQTMGRLPHLVDEWNQSHDVVNVAAPGSGERIMSMLTAVRCEEEILGALRLLIELASMSSFYETMLWAGPPAAAPKAQWEEFVSGFESAYAFFMEQRGIDTRRWLEDVALFETECGAYQGQREGLMRTIEEFKELERARATAHAATEGELARRKEEFKAEIKAKYKALRRLIRTTHSQLKEDGAEVEKTRQTIVRQQAEHAGLMLSLKEANESLSGQIQSLYEHNNEVVSQRDKLIEDYKTLEQANEKLVAKNQHYEATMKKLVEDFSQSCTETKALEDRARQAIEKEREASREFLERGARIEALVKEKHDIEAGAKATVRMHAFELIRLRERAQEIEEQKQKFEDAAKITGDEKRVLIEQVDALRAQVSNLRTELDLEYTKYRASTNGREHARLRERVEQLEQQKLEFEDEAKTSNTENQILVDQEAALRRELETVRGQIAKLRASLDAGASLRHELDLAKGQVAQTRLSLDAAVERAKQLADEKQAVEHKLVEANELLAARQAMAADFALLQGKVDDAHHSLDAATTGFEAATAALSEENRGLHARAAMLERELDAAQLELEQHREQAEAQTKVVESLNMTIHGVKTVGMQQLERHERLYDELNTQATRALREAEANLAVVEESVASLERAEDALEDERTLRMVLETELAAERRTTRRLRHELNLRARPTIAREGGSVFARRSQRTKRAPRRLIAEASEE